MDEDAGSREVMAGLALAGCDVVYSQDLGHIGRPDDEHLALARQMGRVLYSCNVADYARIHWSWMAAGLHHTGIVVLTFQQMPQGEQLRRLRAMLSALSSEQMRDQLHYLTNWG